MWRREGRAKETCLLSDIARYVWLIRGGADMSEDGSDKLRQIQVRQLFRARTPNEHNELGVDLFYAWLEKRHPE